MVLSWQGQSPQCVEARAADHVRMNASTALDASQLESLGSAVLVRRFAALADPTRLRILRLLAEPKCVCELNTSVDVAPNLLSYHLRVLREAGLVRATRRGRWIDYHLVPEALNAAAQDLADLAASHQPLGGPPIACWTPPAGSGLGAEEAAR